MNHYDNKTKRALAVYIFIFLLLVTGIAIGGHFSYTNFEQEFHHQAGNQVSAIAELKENGLVGWRRERLVDAQAFYRNSVFSGLVERYFEDPADLKTKNQIISRLEFYQSFAQYDAVCLLDVTGIHRLVIPANSEEFKKADVLLMADAAASLDSGNVIFGDFQRDPNVEGKIYISILVPLFAEQSDGRPLGVLVFHVKPETYLYPYINQWPIPSDTAETLLVRRDGQDVLFLSQLRFEQGAELNLRFPLTRTDILAVNAVLGQTGLVEGVDYRGKQVLADIRPVPDSPWFLVSKVDVDEVYAPLRTRLWQTMLIIGMAIFVAGAGLLTIWRQQRVLFYRAQAEAAEALRASEEKFRKAFILSPDSININRLEDGMYVSINDGFTKITGYAPDEVIGKTSLETDIWADPQDCKKLVEALTKSGEVANLEMRFRMKNGEIRQGLMSASVLELNGTPHIISITRDISGHKLADEKLRQAQMVLENSPVVLFRWKAVAGWPVELVSENIFQFGYRPEEFLSGATPYASFIHPDDLERVGREVSEYSANGVDRFQQEYRIVTRDGQVRWTDDQTMIERDTQGNITHYQGTIMDITERKQAEDALRQSEENLSTTLHSIGDGVISTDKDGLIASMNPVAEKYCGWTLAEANGKPLTKVFNIINAETRKRVENPVARVMESGQIAGLANHTVLISKNGREYQIADSAAPIKNKNGEITGVVLAFSDVTEKYKAEQILRESEESFADIYQTVSEGIAYTTLGGQVLSINKSLEKILGIPQEQIVGKNILSLAKDLLSAENIKKAVPVLVNLVQGRKIQPFEIEYKNKIIEVTATINKASGRLTGVIRDITERKRAEDELKRNINFTSTLLYAIPTPVFYKDRSGRYQGCNQAFTEVMGVTSDEIKGKTVHDLWPSELSEVYHRKDVELMDNPQHQSYEFRVRDKNGIMRPVIYAKDVFRDADGQVGGMVGAFIDITERKQAEDALLASEQMLHNILENFPGVVFWKDTQSTYLGCNQSFAVGAGLDSSTEIIGKTDFDLPWSTTEAANYRADDYEVMQSGKAKLHIVETQHQSENRLTWFDTSKIPLRDSNGQVMGVFEVATDITERKRAEEALRENEEKYRRLFDNAPLGIFQSTPDGKIISINSAFTQMLGYDSPDDAIENIKNISTDIFADPNRRAEIIRLMADNPNLRTFENVYRRKDGSTFIGNLNVTPVRDADGRIIRMEGIVEDITERKQAEERLAQFFLVNLDLLCIADLEGNFIKVNNAWESILGYSTAELEQRKFLEFVHPEDMNSTLEVVATLGKQEQVLNFVNRCRCMDGTYRFIEWRSQPFGNLIYAAARDITERKQVEEELRRQTTLFRNLFESSPEAIAVLDHDDRVLEINRSFEILFGYLEDEVRGRSINDLVASNLYLEDARDVSQTVLGIGQVVEKESIRCTKDGSLVDVSIIGYPIVVDQHVLGAYAIYRDITARKQAEAELDRQTTLFRNLFEGSPEAIAIVDPEDRVLNVNRSFETLFGYLEAEAQGHYVNDLLVSEPYLEEARSINQISLESHQIVERETVRHTKDGRLVNVSLIGYPVSLSQRPIGGFSIYRDITERKQAEQALRDSQQLLQAVIDNIPQCIFWKDSLLNYLGCNGAFATSVGLASPNDIVGKTDFDLPSKHAELYRADDNFVMKSGVPKLNYEEPQTTPDGATTWLRTSKIPMRNVDGNVYAVLGLYEDITERKRSEEALKESEAIFSSFLENSPVYVFFKDKDIRSLMLSKNYEQMLGMPISDLLGKTMDDLFPSDLAKSMVADDLQVLNEGRRVTIEEEFNGHAYETTKFPVIKDGKPHILAGFTVDITERKRAEEALRESEERLRLAVSAGRMGTWDRNFLTGKLNWSIECKAMFGLTPEIEMNDELFTSTIYPEDRAPTDMAIREALEKQTDFDTEYRVIWSDGTIHWIAAQGRGYYNEAGQAIHMAGVTSDITERKQAEEALLESEERFRTLYDNATVGLYRTTPDGRILMLNPAGLRMLGFDSFDEVARLNLEQNRYNLDYSRKEFREKLESQGVIIGWENGWIKKDGSAIFVRESAKAFRDENGKVLYYDGSFEDVSARVQAETALRESERLYRKMNQNSPLGMHFYKLAGEELVFVGANPAADKLLGVANSQFVGKTIDEAFPPLTQTEVPQRYRNAAANGIPWSTEQIDYQDGLIRGAFEVKAFQTTPGNMVAVFADITARKQAEAAVLESRARFQGLVETLNEWIWEINAEGCYTYVSPQIKDMLGYEPEEMLGKMPFDFMPPEEVQRVAKIFDSYLSARQPLVNLENTNRRRDGSLVVLETSGSSFYDAQGEFMGYRGIDRDITERKRIEEEIRNLNVELEQRVRERTVQLEITNKELEAFSYSVSHDLRAPLRGIDGWSQALLEDYYDRLDEQGQQYIDRVRSETQRMGRLIDDMLQLSRLTRAEMVKEQVDLSALAQTIVERLKRDEPQRQAYFDIQVGVTAEGDAHLLEVVLGNLLGNAFKFTGKRADARIEFGRTDLQGQCVFFVRDNGAGFDMTYAKKLFGAFQRMHKVSEFPGTGVGLATVQRIIHRHGGRVWAEAEAGRGATFYFTLE